MFDLSRILRIRVLGIPGRWSFGGNPLNNNDKERRWSETNININTVSGGWFGSYASKFFSDGDIGDHSLFYIRWPLGFPIISLMGHPDIHSLSPYQLIKYLINYPIRNLIALLLNLISNQLRLTIDK